LSSALPTVRELYDFAIDNLPSLHHHIQNINHPQHIEERLKKSVVDGTQRTKTGAILLLTEKYVTSSLY